MPLFFLAARLGKLWSFIVTAAGKCRQEGDVVSRGGADGRRDVMMTEVGRLVLNASLLAVR